MLETYTDVKAWVESLATEEKGVWILTGPADAARGRFYYALFEHLLSRGKQGLSLERKPFAHVRGLQQVNVVERPMSDAVAEGVEQAPDILGVSEMEAGRDAELAFLAGARLPVLAVLTSYDSLSALGWLLERRLRSPLKAGLCKGILALRAFDGLCEHCAEHYALKPADAKILAAWGFSETPLFASAGCDACRSGGGDAPPRVVVPEVLDAMEHLPPFLAAAERAPALAADARRDEMMKSHKPLILRRGLELAAARKVDARSVLRAFPAI